MMTKYIDPRNREDECGLTPRQLLALARKRGWRTLKIYGRLHIAKEDYEAEFGRIPYRELVAANINVGGEAVVSLVTPYMYDAKRRILSFYWFNGPTRASAILKRDGEPGDEEMVVLRSYGRLAEDDDEGWEKAELDFLLTYHPMRPVSPPTPDHRGEWHGWIAPNGDYYVVAYGDHDGAAKAIMATRYNLLRPSSVARERLLVDWLQLRQTGKDNGLLVGRMEHSDITKAQAATVRAINELTNGLFARSLTARLYYTSEMTAVER